MVGHFAEWLEAEHQVRFAFETRPLLRRDDRRPRRASRWRSTRHGSCSTPSSAARCTARRWSPGRVEALGRIGEAADIVILTNLGNEAHPWRVDQLASHGIRHDVICNSGGKGSAGEERSPGAGRSATVFVDDLPMHHASVAKHAPKVWRLHMIAEPRVAPAVPAAEHAHARIDDWPSATRLDPRPTFGEAMTKTILITGATAGFGQAAARRFAAGGWRVIGTGRRARAAARAVRRAWRCFPAARSRHARQGSGREPRASCRRRGATSTCCSTMPGWRRRRPRCPRPTGSGSSR